MFGVSAFINYTIAVAVWARFCFHVFLMWSCAICGAFLSGIYKRRAARTIQHRIVRFS